MLGAVTNDGYRKNRNTGGPLDNDDKLSARVQTLVDLGPGTTLLMSGDIADQDLAGGSRYNVKPSGYSTTAPFGYRDFDTPRSANPDRPGFIKDNTGGAKAELNTDALGFAMLTASAAWRTLDYDSSEDLDGTDAAGNAAAGVAAPALQVLAKEKADSYSGEVRLASNGTAPFTWVAGLYYLHDDTVRERRNRDRRHRHQRGPLYRPRIDRQLCRIR